jgi:hypothetical protein
MNSQPVPIIPSWASILPILVHVAESGTTAQGRAEAMAELQRMARIADEGVPALLQAIERVYASAGESSEWIRTRLDDGKRAYIKAVLA